MLKFTDEVLYGENIKYPPYWAGIEKITSLLSEIKEKTTQLEVGNILDEFNDKIKIVNGDGTIIGLKKEFENKLDEAKTTIFTTENYKNGDYQLDIAYQFGEEDDDYSVYQLWKKEYGSITTIVINLMKV